MKAIHPKEFAEGEQVVCEKHPDKELFFIKSSPIQPKGFLIQMKDKDDVNHWANHIGKSDK